MESPLRLGQLCDAPEGRRDAVHVAIVAVVADEFLGPGDRAELVPGTADRVRSGHANPVGVVDPFLANPVSKGDRFLLLLFPDTTTGLRHVWSHPAFADRPDADDAAGEAERARQKEESRAWLEDLGRSGGDDANLDWVVQTGHEALERGWGQCYSNEDVQDAINENKKEFWRHWSAFTGVKGPVDPENVYFSCSC